MNYKAKDYVLVKNDSLDFPYDIMSKTRLFIIIEDFTEAKRIIASLLEEGVDIYNDLDAYNKDFPSETLPFEKRRQKDLESWDGFIPEEKWTKEVREAIKKSVGI